MGKEGEAVMFFEAKSSVIPLHGSGSVSRILEGYAAEFEGRHVGNITETGKMGAQFSLSVKGLPVNEALRAEYH